jgi:hypothetical protein
MWENYICEVYVCVFVNDLWKLIIPHTIHLKIFTSKFKGEDIFQFMWPIFVMYSKIMNHICWCKFISLSILKYLCVFSSPQMLSNGLSCLKTHINKLLGYIREINIHYMIKNFHQMTTSLVGEISCWKPTLFNDHIIKWWLLFKFGLLKWF